MPIALRSDTDAVSVRAAARRSKDGAQARRLLALAAIYEGSSRTEATRIGRVTLQIVRDWVLKCNTAGPDGLIDRKAPGKPPLLNAAHRAALIEAIERFGGVPTEGLLDNARALVDHHDAATREVRFNARLHAFARYWGFCPRACAPYRARTKGKDERGVGYVKRNAVAGRRFASWAAFEGHLEQWNREIADVRVHGTTGEKPALRFADEASALRPLGGRAPFGQLRDLVRKVRPDCAIDLDTNSYSVPWRLVGETVQVVVLAGRIIVRHAGEKRSAKPSRGRQCGSCRSNRPTHRAS